MNPVKKAIRKIDFKKVYLYLFINGSINLHEALNEIQSTNALYARKLIRSAYGVLSRVEKAESKFELMTNLINSK